MAYAPLPKSGTQVDFSAYVSGYETQAQNPAMADQPARGPFFVAGQTDRRAGNQPQLVSFGNGVFGPNPNLPPVDAPAAKKPWRPTDAQVAEYWRGYQLGKNYNATARAGFAEADPDYYYQLGLSDGGRGVPALWTPTSAPPVAGGPVVYRTPDGRVVQLPPPPLTGGPAPVGNPPIFRPAPQYVPQPNPGFPGWQEPKFYEVYATLLGKGRPLDQVVKLQNLQGPDWLILGVSFGTDIKLLGDNVGDERRGYRLSGPNSAFAKEIRRRIAMGQLPSDPRRLGLDAWYGARTSTGVRLLTARQLQALNFSPDALF